MSMLENAYIMHHIFYETKAIYYVYIKHEMKPVKYALKHRNVNEINPIIVRAESHK
jgi:hypothetical protein